MATPGAGYISDATQPMSSVDLAQISSLSILSTRRPEEYVARLQQVRPRYSVAGRGVPQVRAAFPSCRSQFESLRLYKGRLISSKKLLEAASSYLGSLVRRSEQNLPGLTTARFPKAYIWDMNPPPCSSSIIDIPIRVGFHIIEIVYVYRIFAMFHRKLVSTT